LSYRLTTKLAAAALGGLMAIGAPFGYTFITIGVPGSLPGPTDGFGFGGINNRGRIVGNFKDSPGVVHGFLHSDGTFTTIVPSGSTYDFDQVVQQVCDNTGCHGNVDTRGSIALIVDRLGEVPGAADMSSQCRI
jgi:probable HAF family extracellular repeat protein